MEKTPTPKTSEFDSRGVVNFAKYDTVDKSNPENPRRELRVVACWLHVPKGAALGGKNNRIFIMGFPDDYTEIWTVLDQRLLNREYWEHGSTAFGVAPGTLFPVDISMWTQLSLSAHGFKVTYFDTRNPVGVLEGNRIYDTISINGIHAKYVGRSSGIEASDPEDLLIPSKNGQDFFLHYRIQGGLQIDQWTVASMEGEPLSCQELLFGLVAHSAH